jgi:hypothetical protein
MTNLTHDPEWTREQPQMERLKSTWQEIHDQKAEKKVKNKAAKEAERAKRRTEWKEMDHQIEIRRLERTERRPQAAQDKKEPGYSGRYIGLRPILEIETIWEAADERIKTDRSHFALVHESHYFGTIRKTREPNTDF